MRIKYPNLKVWDTREEYIRENQGWLNEICGKLDTVKSFKKRDTRVPFLSC